MRTRSGISRRELLQTAGALVVYAAASPARSAEPLPRSLAANPDLDRWIRIDRTGTVAVFSGKCELGQGIRTALAQIVADELSVSLERVRMETVDTARSPNEGSTVGSNSIPDGGTALRLAAAEARRILLGNASRRLATDSARLVVDDGLIRLPGTEASVSYWELLGDRSFDTEVGGNAMTAQPVDYRYVGRPEPRLDLPAKIFGEPAFVHDLRLPGMLHARIVRGESYAGGLTLTDESAVRSMPGVVSLVRDRDFLAVVARREEQAVAAADSLRGTARRAPSAYPDPAEFPELLRRLPTEDTSLRAGADTSREGLRELSAAYSRPFIAHASMGPSCAVAEWDGSVLTVHSHAQGMYPLRDALATVTQLPRERIRCIHADGAGCYGHNGADDVACDAALIALGHQGSPIRLLWSREDEFRNEPYGSAMSIEIKAALDESNRIVSWRHELWSCSHRTRPSGGEAAGELLAAREKSDPLPRPPVADLGQPAGGADRNAIPLYTFADQHIVEHLVLEPPLRCSALRSLGAHGNVFAIESMMDELALAANADPFELRLAHLDDLRAREVIEAVRELADRRTARQDGRAERAGRGLGFARYKNLSTYLAVVAEVAVDDRTGAVRLEHAFAAVDAGQVVNPDGLRNQIEGGIVQTASWTLKEQVRFSTTRIESRDWASYPILRFDEAPDIEVEIIDRPDIAFVGAGEAAQGPTAAAIANAIAAATGARLRDMPFTSDRVSAALAENAPVGRIEHA